MYLLYIIKFFTHACYVNSSLEVTLQIALVILTSHQLELLHKALNSCILTWCFIIKGRFHVLLLSVKFIIPSAECTCWVYTVYFCSIVLYHKTDWVRVIKNLSWSSQLIKKWNSELNPVFLPINGATWNKNSGFNYQNSSLKQYFYNTVTWHLKVK